MIILSKFALCLSGATRHINSSDKLLSFLGHVIVHVANIVFTLIIVFHHFKFAVIATLVRHLILLAEVDDLNAWGCSTRRHTLSVTLSRRTL